MTFYNTDKMNVKSKMIEYFEKTFINIPFWFLEEDSRILTFRRLSFTPRVTKEQLLLGIKSKNQQFKSIVCKLFIHVYEVLKMVITMTFFANKLVPETNYRASIIAESRVENLTDIMQTLKRYASSAEEEHNAIVGNVKDMKNQIVRQAESLCRNRQEINDLEEAIKMADAYSARQMKIIADLENERKEQRENLSSAERKLKGIAEQLLPHSSINSLEDSEKFCDDNYLLIIDHIQELKTKVQQQENLLAKMQQIIGGLDELSHVKQNISKQTELINNFKNGLRRKSIHLLENLKSIAGQANTSSFVENTELEDLQDFNKSLTVLVQNTPVFLDEINNKYEILEKDGYRHISEIWSENSNFTVIKCSSNNKNNSLIISNQKEANYSKVITLDQGIQTERINESVDVSCQTDESNSEVKMEIVKLTNKYNEKTIELSTSRDELLTYQNYKKENAILKDSLEAISKENTNMKIEITKLSASNRLKQHEIDTIKKAIENMQKSNEEMMEAMEQKSEIMNKEYKNKNDQLFQVKDSIKDLQNSYNNEIEKIKQQFQSAQQLLFAKQKDNIDLKNKLESLNKKLRSNKTEYENVIHRKEQIIAVYKNSSTAKRAEIESLKRELTDDKSLRKIEFERAIDMQNFHSSKENQGKYVTNSQVVYKKNRLPASNITFRERYQKE